MSVFFMAAIPQTEATVDISATDYICPVNTIGIRATGAGNVRIKTRTGDVRDRDLVAGQHWTIMVSSVVREGTTATGLVALVA